LGRMGRCCQQTTRNRPKPNELLQKWLAMQLAPIAATAWSGLGSLARPLSEAPGDFAALLSSAGDQLTASDDATPQDPLRLAAGHSLPPLPPIPSRFEAEADLARVQRQLEDLFRDAGIDLSQDVRLAIDATGQIRVEGDHP